MLEMLYKKGAKIQLELDPRTERHIIDFLKDLEKKVSFERLNKLVESPDAAQKIKDGFDPELPESDQGWLLREAVRLGKYDLAQAVAEKYPDQINSTTADHRNAAAMALWLPEEAAKEMLEMLYAKDAKIQVGEPNNSAQILQFAAHHNPGFIDFLKTKQGITEEVDVRQSILDGFLDRLTEKHGVKEGKFNWKYTREDLENCIDYKAMRENQEYRSAVTECMNSSSKLVGNYVEVDPRKLQSMLLETEPFKPAMNKIKEVIKGYNEKHKNQVSDKDLPYIAAKIFTGMVKGGVSRDDIKSMEGELLKGMLEKHLRSRRTSKGKTLESKHIKKMASVFKAAKAEKEKVTNAQKGPAAPNRSTRNTEKPLSI